MLAKLLDAFTIPAGRLTEVEVGWALASTKLRSKHNRRQEINSLPRERVSPPFPTPYSPELQGANHTQARTHTQTLLHPLMQTHKCWHSRTLTQIHTCFSPPHSLCRGEAGRSPRSVPKQAPLCLLSPMKLIFRRSEFPWSVCLPLPKVKSSHEIKLKALEQSMKTFCSPWRLALPGTKINARNRNLITWKKSRNPSA